LNIEVVNGSLHLLLRDIPFVDAVDWPCILKPNAYDVQCELDPAHCTNALEVCIPSELALRELCLIIVHFISII
jgi:hypothetical protein